MFASSEEIDISPVIDIPLLGRNWLGACIRSLKPDEGHTHEEHFLLALSSDCSKKSKKYLLMLRMKF
jgi:hypothetical protein